MAFMACLNLLDIVTDILVLLRYSCILESDAGEPCAGSVPNSSCQPHPWWTFIGLMILSVSTFLSAMVWVNPAAKNFSEKIRSKKVTLRDWAMP